MITRRSFLQASGGAAVCVGRARGADDSGRALVVLQLAGGNDGLNTVVPYEDDQYGRARTTLRLGGSQVLKIGSSLGFHPEMRGFARLFGEGRLAVLQGVGYPNMSRNHGGAMKNWQTGNLSPREQTGWLGRAVDRASDPEAGNVPAVFVGRIPRPLAIHAREAVVPTIRDARDWTVAPGMAAGGCQPSGALAGFAACVTAAAAADARKITGVLDAGGAREYPRYGLAQSLRTVSQLIRAEIGICIYLVEQGGVPPGSFDNHANQAGNHAVLLRELSDSVAAFCDDLQRVGLFDRVLLMTYSEFGRTLSENGRHGTGHGAAAPVFLAGGKVKGGLVGAHPSLKDLDQDAPKPHTDYRAVYATMLERWLGMPSEPVLDGRFGTVEALG